MSIERIIRVVPTTSGVPWKCLDCGECCERISISKQEYKLILNKISPKVQEIFKQNTKSHIENPKFMLIRGRCPFFTKKKGRCLIYKIRPFPCRFFICGRKSMDEKLIFVNGRCINHMIRIKSDPYFRDQVANSTHEAKEWGIRHGWPRRKYKHESADTIHRKIR